MLSQCSPETLVLPLRPLCCPETLVLSAIGEEHLEEDAMALWHAALSSGLATCPGLLELFGRLVQLLEAGPDNLEVFMPLPGLTD